MKICNKCGQKVNAMRILRGLVYCKSCLIDRLTPVCCGGVPMRLCGEEWKCNICGSTERVGIK